MSYTKCISFWYLLSQITTCSVTKNVNKKVTLIVEKWKILHAGASRAGFFQGDYGRSYWIFALLILTAPGNLGIHLLEDMWLQSWWHHSRVTLLLSVGTFTRHLLYASLPTFAKDTANYWILGYTLALGWALNLVICAKTRFTNRWES